MKGIMGTGRIARGSLVALSAFFALGLAFGPAFAATIVVDTDEPTITAAVLAAFPGDTIIINKGKGTGNNGEYHEAVVVTKTLTIICKGAVLDAAKPSSLGGGPTVLVGEGFDIGPNPAANGTTVRGCTIQNFDDQGIEVTADDVTIINNTFINNSSQGLHIDGDNFVVKGNHAINNGGDGEEGFRLHSGDDGTVIGNHSIANNSKGFNLGSSDNKRYKILNNRAFRNSSGGFEIEGEEHTIRGNRAEVNNGDGFQFGDDEDTNKFIKSLVERNLARKNNSDGFSCVEVNDGDDIGCDGNTFERNVALNNGSKGFDFPDECVGDCGDGDPSNDDNKFIRNLAIGHEQQGFAVFGDDNTFIGNRAIENQDEGFKLHCVDTPGPGDMDGVCGGPVIGNRSIRNAADEGFEFTFFDDTTVSGNKAIGNREEGFQCSTCDEVLFENNLARDNSEEGFQIDFSSTNTFINNRVMRNARDGFRLQFSDSNTLVRNTIVRNDGDGIDVDTSDSDDTVIDDNIVRNNRGTGIENDGGSDTDIKNNVVKGNHTDIAGRGDLFSGDGGSCTGAAAATDGGSNTFDTGGFEVCTPGTGDE